VEAAVRSYVTIVDDMTDLLPYFVRYYSERLGVSEFCVLVYGDPATMDLAEQVVKDAGARFVQGAMFDAESFLAGHRDCAVREIHGNGGWAYFTDLDEFPQLDFERDLAHAQRNGVPYIAGRWIDRVAPNGRLVCIDPARRLEEQFPYACRVSGHYRLLDNVYVLSSRAPFSHHPATCQWGWKWWAQCAPVHVHHFRWQANLLPRLERRVERVDRANNHRWAGDVRRMLDYVREHRGVDERRICHIGDVIGC
jgi:hypothetical protein